MSVGWEFQMLWTAMITLAFRGIGRQYRHFPASQ